MNFLFFYQILLERQQSVSGSVDTHQSTTPRISDKSAVSEFWIIHYKGYEVLNDGYYLERIGWI